jgi:hypothetical protein
VSALPSEIEREQFIMTAADSQKITRPLSIHQFWIGTSVLVSVLVTITSLFDIFVKTTYLRETSAWAIQAVGQDCANLVVVIVLIISTFFVDDLLMLITGDCHRPVRTHRAGLQRRQTLL